jgi:hypothetical protein
MITPRTSRAGQSSPQLGGRSLRIVSNPAEDVLRIEPMIRISTKVVLLIFLSDSRANTSLCSSFLCMAERKGELAASNGCEAEKRRG